MYFTPVAPIVLGYWGYLRFYTHSAPLVLPIWTIEFFFCEFIKCCNSTKIYQTSKSQSQRDGICIDHYLSHSKPQRGEMCFSTRFRNENEKHHDSKNCPNYSIIIMEFRIALTHFCCRREHRFPTRCLDSEISPTENVISYATTHL